MPFEQVDSGNLTTPARQLDAVAVTPGADSADPQQSPYDAIEMVTPLDKADLSLSADLGSADQTIEDTLPQADLLNGNDASVDAPDLHAVMDSTASDLLSADIQSDQVDSADAAVGCIDDPWTVATATDPALQLLLSDGAGLQLDLMHCAPGNNDWFGIKTSDGGATSIAVYFKESAPSRTVDLYIHVDDGLGGVSPVALKTASDDPDGSPGVNGVTVTLAANTTYYLRLFARDLAGAYRVEIYPPCATADHCKARFKWLAVCDAGACIECIGDDDCKHAGALGPSCVNQQCIADCQTVGMCAQNENGTLCDAGKAACVCDSDADCADGLRCETRSQSTYYLAGWKVCAAP